MAAMASSSSSSSTRARSELLAVVVMMRRSVMMLVAMAMMLCCGSWSRGLVEAALSRGVEIQPYGRLPDGRQVVSVTLTRGHIRLSITNWGATITSLHLPDSQGNLADVVLGYDSLKGYQNGTAYFGAIVGRVANRIAGGTFVIDQVRYNITRNEGNNTLHGGKIGYDKVLWDVSSKLHVDGSPSATFRYHSFDGEEGFPGAVNVSVKYKLNKHKELLIDMKGVVGARSTPLNLAQHTYWNLGGHNSGTILNNEVEILANRVTLVDEELIPTGKLKDVKGTPYDFTTRRSIASHFSNLSNGYDINYALRGGRVISVDGVDLHLAARVTEPTSRRTMELFTNQPGLQFYTANYVDGIRGKNGSIYQPQSALCLETQGFPNAINQPNFPSVLVKRGHVYRHRMLFRFSVLK